MRQNPVLMSASEMSNDGFAVGALAHPAWPQKLCEVLEASRISQEEISFTREDIRR